MVNRCEIFDEDDIDAALAKFGQFSLPALRLKISVGERISAHIAARDWDALAQDFADGYCLDDRRRVVNAGVMHGRDAGVENTRVAAEVGLLANTTSTIIASRGERLTLERFHASGPDHESIQNEALNIVEIDADERIAAVAMFDLDDIDAAFEELDARYLAGEAAAHAHAWSVIASIYAGFNRREPPATTPDSVFTDHRPLQNLGAVDLVAAIRSMWDVASDLNVCIEAVHRLSELGAVVTQTLKGTSQEGLDAEWRTIEIFTVEGDLLSRCEAFDEADLDAALARFEELHPPTPRHENAASRLHERFLEYYAAEDSLAMAEMLAVNYSSDDRRRVVGSGVRDGRDPHIADMRARAELWNTNLESTVMAIRGERLALMRIGLSDRDEEPEAFSTEVLAIGEIDADERIVASVTFDLDEIDAAFAELDARYLAGEAAAHANTWSVIAGAHAAFNRHELPATTSDPVYIDHRPFVSIEGVDLGATLRAVWDITPASSVYIEAVHRLDEVGAVATQVLTGTSQQGLDAEWRMIDIFTVEGDLLSRCEAFDEADLDAALARFEELHPQPPRLENAATQVVERFWAYFEARDWDAMAETWAENYCTHDRRRVVNAGVLRGRADHLTNMRAVAEVGFERLTSTVIATRGQRLALIRIRSSVRGSPPGEVNADVPSIVEIDADGRLAATAHFDPDDIDAAFAELEARYLAGEAAEHSRVWSAITAGFAALNRHEMPPTTPDWVNVDHRRGIAFASGELTPYIRATFDVAPDITIRIEVVHQLTSLGAVISYSGHGTSQEGFDAVWRESAVFVVDGDLVSHCEMYDEADLDAALARFEELSRSVPHLKNAASQLVQRFHMYFAARNWAAVAEHSAPEIFTDDRRSVVGSGILHGRDIDVANIRAIADLGATDLTSTVIATRGERLVLTRVRLSGRDQRPEAFHSEMLGIVEIDADNRVAARFLFDLNDIDAAFEELDARYLAGDAAAHAHIWSVIALTTAAFNRHELLATDWVTIDHRTLAPIDASALPAAMRAAWDLTPNFSTHIEAVHQLSGLGAVVTYTAYGTSLEGFAAEWRMVDLVTVEGDRISRVEFFDETDLDAALARFDELERQTPSIENAATRTWSRVADAFNRRDVDGLLALASAESRYEDRRKGLRDIIEAPSWRKALVVVIQTVPSSWRMEVEPIAIRGSRLSLTRGCYRDVDDADRPIAVELLHVIELDDADLMRDIVSFDPDDLDDANAELTARWIASGEVAYPELLEAVDRINAAINRHEWDSVAKHFEGADYVDHRQLGHAVNGTIADWLSSLQTTGSLAPNFWVELAEILARCAIGIVGRMALKGTSTDGAAIEVSFVVIVVLRSERVTRLEVFDDDQRDLALARLQELNQPV